MNTLLLSQIQFAVTCVYHFFFVPLTLGLSVLVAIMETIYVRTGQDVYKRMAKFWGKLFLINFAMGVVTGIVMEFQFGMNWSEYARFVGDIFGAPLAIEALLAFFLESTFLGLWIFGWEKLSKGWHAFTIWMVALGSNISALWILIANSFMQAPTGYVMQNNQPVMSDFGALVTNPNIFVQFPHTILSGFTTGAFFVLGISAYHLLRKKETDFFNRSFRIATIFGFITVLLVVLVGHRQMQYMVNVQPMKFAAAEALWETENPASFSLISIPNQAELKDVFSIRIPWVASLLAFNRLDGEIKGVRDLQAMYAAQYGADNYVPSVLTLYLSFRIMVGAGTLMLLIAAYFLYRMVRKQPVEKFRFFWLAPYAIALPYFANTTGWLMTEMGRQPWIVFGLLKTADAVSPTVTPGMVLTSLVLFTLLYGLLMAADVYLLSKYARTGPEELQESQNVMAVQAYQE